MTLPLLKQKKLCPLFIYIFLYFSSTNIFTYPRYAYATMYLLSLSITYEVKVTQLKTL